MTLRVERAQWTRLTWAFVISLVLHAMIYGGHHLGQKYDWWRYLQLPAWLAPEKMLADFLRQEQKAEQQQVVELPLLFVDVSPQQATVEAPKKTEFYSDKNSKAANPEPTVETLAPKIDGQQTEIVKTEDVPRQKAFPLQPAIPVQPPKEEQEQVQPKSTEKPGDLALAKPSEDQKQPIAKTPQPAKPKTVKEALAQLPNDQRAGEKMKQEGGVKRSGRVALDVTATAFGAYDARLIMAVQNRWYDLLDNRQYASDRIGRVKVRFHLHADGTVSEMAFIENTADLPLGLLCQSAIRDSTPYDPWPTDMRRMIGAEYREITFTFYYN